MIPRLSLFMALFILGASAQNQFSSSCTDSNGPTITKPVNGGTVVLTDIVRGTSPCPAMKHYVIVTPPNGADWVQSKPFDFQASGAFSTRAQFGEGTVGIGETFLIRILVTKEAVRPGQLRQMPADAILSKAVSVTRNQ